jgi:glyoxylase-like metal-dependent hydrolase (beta-lactamase superfamily II)
VQRAPSETPPAACPVCQDFRQYVNPDGQRWSSLDQIAEAHQPDVREVEPGLTGVGLEPGFAIGQRGLLVRTPSGNLLWDLAPMTPALAAAVRDAGGVAAIAVSHPHFYSTMAEWSREFQAPVWLPADDRPWRARSDFTISEWSGQAEPLPGLTLLQTGGHFAGSAVLHWSEGADSEGALLTGDTIYVAQDRRWVSFMRSYPNLIPLPAHDVVRISEAVAPYRFQRLYGGWYHAVVMSEADLAVQRSAERYLRSISEGLLETEA